MAGGDIGYSQYNHSDQRDLPRCLQFLIACSMQKLGYKPSKCGGRKGLGTKL